MICIDRGSKKDAKIAAMRNIHIGKVLMAKCPKLFSSNICYYIIHRVDVLHNEKCRRRGYVIKILIKIKDDDCVFNQFFPLCVSLSFHFEEINQQIFEIDKPVNLPCK